MPPRPRIPDAQILDAARAVFLEQGPGASTLAIAARAGVSEGLVFKRFGTKQHLFDTAMAGVRPRWMSLLEGDEGPVPEQLERVALAMIETMRAELPRTMLQWSNNPKSPRFTSSGARPVEGLKVLSAWFETLMKQGRMRRSDPELLARVYSGAIVAFSMSEMTGLAHLMPLATTTFVRGLVDALWQGAQSDARPD